MELFISDKNVEFSNACQIAAEYLNLLTQIKVSKSSEETKKFNNVSGDFHVFLKTDEGKIETSTINILEQICRKSNFHKALLGRDETESKQIHDFLANLNNLSNLVDANKYLESRTYVALDHITIGDIVLYSNLIGSIKKLSDKDKQTNSNLIRYGDFIQHIPVLGESLLKRDLTFNLNLEQKWNNLAEGPSQGNVDKKKNKREDKLKAKEEYFKKHEESKAQEGTTATPNISINTNVPEQKAKEEKKPKEDKKDKAQSQTQNQPKEEKKAEPKKEQKQQQAKKKEEDDVPAISKLDIRVGKIVKIVPNEESDKLYNEEIDIGNGEIRTIASGLKKRIPIEVLKDSMVIVLCNLKGRKLCNYFSHGMVRLI
jgi:methionine--tRNA ligase beta chain